MNATTRRSYPRIEFTQDVYEKHVRNMERIAALALDGRSGWDKATATHAHGWSPLAEHMGWEILSLQQHAGVHEYLCLGTMQTSIEALQEAFYVKNTYELRAVGAVLYEDAIADAALLNVTHPRTDEDPGQFFGVKYLKLIVQVVNEEDQEQEYIYLEFSGTRYDAHGRKTFFVISDPVSIRPHDVATSSHHAALSSGERCSCVKLYREAPDGTVQVTIRTKLEPGVAAPKAKKAMPHHHLHGTTSVVTTSKASSANHLVFWKSMGLFIPSGLSKDLLGVSREACAAEARRLTTGPFASSWAHGSKCHVCFKTFNVFKRKHHCRRCGSSMCGACSVPLHCVDRPTKSRTSHALTVEKFCKTCFVQAKGLAARPSSSLSSSSTMSSTNNNTIPDWDAPRLPSDAVAYLHSPHRGAHGEFFFLQSNQSSSSRSGSSYSESLSHSESSSVSYPPSMIHEPTPPLREYAPGRRAPACFSMTLLTDDALKLDKSLDHPKGRLPTRAPPPPSHCYPNEDAAFDDALLAEHFRTLMLSSKPREPQQPQPEPSSSSDARRPGGMRPMPRQRY
ncbi:Aste57867_21311 [Aphanomyces stellatus]|uniref:Aste57867_21311 protein n=1 Tax=Aphanomyces stellatus TaxID=120398 RepID=A0A485LJA2_9STRA|nr:hypothetical protein As57867_021242 [Aphanomyces stellatus]VFT97983.1 Aste57867_21311 [Aphanomyces stellatus]